MRINIQGHFRPQTKGSFAFWPRLRSGWALPVWKSRPFLWGDAPLAVHVAGALGQGLRGGVFDRDDVVASAGHRRLVRHAHLDRGWLYRYLAWRLGLAPDLDVRFVAC